MPRRTAPTPRQRAIARFFANVWVELAIGALVLVSVVLTLVEFTIESSNQPQASLVFQRVRFANDLITYVFIVELSLRWFSYTSKARFFREYWIDIVAVIPVFRIFRGARAVRLLRLIRLLRMFGVVSRLSSHFPDILRRGAVEYMFICGLLALTVVFGTGAMMFFESRGAAAVVPANNQQAGQPQPPDDGSFNLESSFWFSVYSLFAGEPIPGPPRTVGGKMVAVMVMFMGLTIFAMFTGAVSAFMVERMRLQGDNVDWDSLENHIIICGYNSKAEIIIEEYQATRLGAQTPIAVIAKWEHETSPALAQARRNVKFLNDDFTRIAALEQAGVHRAKTCIILADMSGGRSEQDADARTILAALTVEKLNPKVYTCAELLNRSYGSHLTMGHVNDHVVSGEFAAYMLAQASMNRGLMGVFTELLTYQHGNEFYRLPLPAQWIGKSFLDVLTELKRDHNAILMGVHPEGGKMLVNPADHTFAAGDEIVVVAEGELMLE